MTKAAKDYESTTIVDNQGFIKAWITGEQLTVYRSAVVREDEQPTVILALLERPHIVLVDEVVEDEEMIFREGLLSVYRFTD